MSNWIKHDGKSMPVDGDVKVYVMFNDGHTDEKSPYPWPAKAWGTNLDNSNWTSKRPNGIAAYRIAS